jgi:hypothetical protein
MGEDDSYCVLHNIHRVKQHRVTLPNFLIYLRHTAMYEDLLQLTLQYTHNFVTNFEYLTTK